MVDDEIIDLPMQLVVGHGAEYCCRSCGDLSGIYYTSGDLMNDSSKEHSNERHRCQLDWPHPSQDDVPRFLGSSWMGYYWPNRMKNERHSYSGNTTLDLDIEPPRTDLLGLDSALAMQHPSDALTFPADGQQNEPCHHCSNQMELAEETSPARTCRQSTVAESRSSRPLLCRRATDVLRHHGTAPDVEDSAMAAKERDHAESTETSTTRAPSLPREALQANPHRCSCRGIPAEDEEGGADSTPSIQGNGSGSSKLARLPRRPMIASKGVQTNDLSFEIDGGRQPSRSPHLRFLTGSSYGDLEQSVEGLGSSQSGSGNLAEVDAATKPFGKSSAVIAVVQATRPKALTLKKSNSRLFRGGKCPDGSVCEGSRIFLDCVEHVSTLMVDPLGNYFHQQLLGVINDQQLGILVRRVCKDVLPVSLDIHGTRGIQALIERTANTEWISLLIEAIGAHVPTLAGDAHGHHVLQKCLSRVGPHENQYIYGRLQEDCERLAMHRHGCCVLQRALDGGSVEQRLSLMSALQRHALKFVQDAYGNYVIQYVLNMKEDAINDQIIEKLLGNIFALSKQKFASNVVEKTLCVGSEKMRHLIICELLNGGSQAIRSLLLDPFGNYVLQRALYVASDSQLAQLAQLIAPAFPQLRQTPNGKRIALRIAKKYPILEQCLTPEKMNGNGRRANGESGKLRENSQQSQQLQQQQQHPQGQQAPGQQPQHDPPPAQQRSPERQQRRPQGQQRQPQCQHDQAMDSSSASDPPAKSASSGKKPFYRRRLQGVVGGSMPKLASDGSYQSTMAAELGGSLQTHNAEFARCKGFRHCQSFLEARQRPGQTYYSGDMIHEDCEHSDTDFGSAQRPDDRAHLLARSNDFPRSASHGINSNSDPSMLSVPESDPTLSCSMPQCYAHPTPVSHCIDPSSLRTLLGREDGHIEVRHIGAAASPPNCGGGRQAHGKIDNEQDKGQTTTTGFYAFGGSQGPQHHHHIDCGSAVNWMGGIAPQAAYTACSGFASAAIYPAPHSKPRAVVPFPRTCHHQPYIQFPDGTLEYINHSVPQPFYPDGQYTARRALLDQTGFL